MNTQYNGDGFHAQHFQAVAMTSQDFDSWVKGVRQSTVALNGANYRILAESSTPAEVQKQFGDAATPKDVTLISSYSYQCGATRAQCSARASASRSLGQKP
jgi:cytochrome o ubiquinol oxidase subunit 2